MAVREAAVRAERSRPGLMMRRPLHRLTCSGRREARERPHAPRSCGAGTLRLALALAPAGPLLSLGDTCGRPVHWGGNEGVWSKL